MSTTVKTGRAWVPATVAALLVAAFAFGSGLLLEVLIDQNVDAVGDPDSVIGSYVYGPLGPLGGPGLVGDADMSDSLTQLGGGLVPTVVLVFLFTWVGARAARAGSSVPVLFGTWLGTVLGVAVGAATSFEIFLRQNDLTDNFPGLHSVRVQRIDVGLYWGAVVGLAVALVALLAWAIASKPAVDEPTSAPDSTLDPAPNTVPPADTSSFPAPGQHAAPPAPPSPVETVRAPASPHEP